MAVSAAKRHIVEMADQAEAAEAAAEKLRRELAAAAAREAGRSRRGAGAARSPCSEASVVSSCGHQKRSLLKLLSTSVASDFCELELIVAALRILWCHRMAKGSACAP